MESGKEILAMTQHRQYPLPKGSWQHYQEWHGNIMLHWEVDKERLASLIPKGVGLDLFEGKAFISIIAFSVRNLRPRFLPAFPLISNFHEINLRTYVTRDGKPGIYFLSIQAEKLLPATLARYLIGLPYKKAKIIRKSNLYSGRGNDDHLQFSYTTGEDITSILLDYWLTERHCLYEEYKGRLFRIDIHHKPWPLKAIKVNIDDLHYPCCKGAPDYMHYSQFIAVLLWSRTFLEERKI